MPPSCSPPSTGCTSLHASPGYSEEDRPRPLDRTEMFDDEHASVKARYEAAAYEKLGVERDDFEAMDPVIRNRLSTRCYAGEYLEDPDDLKWAGMAAYGSQTVGEAMMESRLLDDVPVLPGLMGAPHGESLEKILGEGNGGLFQQIGWQ